MRSALPLLLFLLVACRDAPTLAGGLELDRNGRLFFVRDGALHVTIDDEFTAHPAMISSPSAHGPSLSPNGRSLAWNEGGSVVVLDRATGARRVITPARMVDALPAWTADGREVMVRRRDPDNGTVRLVRVDPWSGTETVVPYEPASSSFTFGWSERRGEVVLPRYDNEVYGEHLVQVNVATGEETVFLPAVEGMSYVFPAWSPDGSRLAVLERVLGDITYRYALVIRNDDGAEETRLLVNLASSISWSPDGRRVAFCQEAQETVIRYRNEIRIWNIDEGTTFTITPLDRNDCGPTWGR